MSTTWRYCDQTVLDLAAEIVRKFHPEIDGVEIRYIFRSKAANRGPKTILGTARKVGGVNALLACGDAYDGVVPQDFFLIELAEDCWKELNVKQKKALLDHELCHCSITEDNKLTMVPHDLEEFGAIVKRHGLWKSDLKMFAKACVEKQAELQFD